MALLDYQESEQSLILWGLRILPVTHAVGSCEPTVPTAGFGESLVLYVHHMVVV